MMATLDRAWIPGLAAILAGYYVVLGMVIGGTSGVVGIGGGLLIGVALVLRGRSRPIAGALLVAGAVPLAVMLWWSVVAPLLALLTLALGALMLLRGRAKLPLATP